MYFFADKFVLTTIEGNVCTALKGICCQIILTDRAQIRGTYIKYYKYKIRKKHAKIALKPESEHSSCGPGSKFVLYGDLNCLNYQWKVASYYSLAFVQCVLSFYFQILAMNKFSHTDR